jgi:hypothetical protein
VIDPRIKYVGTAKLRAMNSDVLRDLQDTVFVIQHKDQPIAVLLSYDLYLMVQAAASTNPDGKL